MNIDMILSTTSTTTPHSNRELGELAGLEEVLTTITEEMNR